MISPAKLSISARQLLQTNTICVGEISLFEIAIKQTIGKLPDLPVTIEMIMKQIEQNGFELMPLTNNHIAAYRRIPFFEDHRDPFDRLILVTALAEQMSVLSADEKFSRYRYVVDVIW